MPATVTSTLNPIPPPGLVVHVMEESVTSVTVHLKPVLLALNTINLVL